jgi:hypothetical protein
MALYVAFAPLLIGAFPVGDGRVRGVRATLHFWVKRDLGTLRQGKFLRPLGFTGLGSAKVAEIRMGLQGEHDESQVAAAVSQSLT